MAERVEIYKDKAGEYRWRKISGSDITSDSGEGYTRREAAHQAAISENPEVDAADIVYAEEESA